MKITVKLNNKIDMLLRETSVILLKNLNLEIGQAFFQFTTSIEFLTSANLLSISLAIVWLFISQNSTAIS